MKRSASYAGSGGVKGAREDKARDDSRLDLTQAPTREQMRLRYGEGIEQTGLARVEILQALATLRRRFSGFQPHEHMLLEPLAQERSKLGPFFQQGFRLLVWSLGDEPEEVWIKMRGLLAIAMKAILRSAGPGQGRGQLVLLNKQLHCPRSTKWGQLSELSIFELLEKLEQAMQSDETISLEDTTIVLRRMTTPV